MQASDLNAVQNAIHELNRNRNPMFIVQSYEVLEVLGSGAFGCVYKVRKIGDQEARLYAMKEIFPTHVQSDDKSIGEIIQEVNIIRQHMRHPNVVRYRRIFTEKGKLYIVMDLIAGTSLRDHINATKEKGQKFSEDRIWHLIVQAILALRYLHKEKQIWHRDLNPNNILLGDQDKVFIGIEIDFF